MFAHHAAYDLRAVKNVWIIKSVAFIKQESDLHLNGGVSGTTLPSATPEVAMTINRTVIYI